MCLTSKELDCLEDVISFLEGTTKVINRTEAAGTLKGIWSHETGNPFGGDKNGG